MDNQELTKLQELLNWLDSYDNKVIKPTYINVKEKVWQLMSEKEN